LHSTQQKPQGGFRDRLGKKDKQAPVPAPAGPPVQAGASSAPPLQVVNTPQPQTAAPPVQRNRFTVPGDVETA
jgi:hypothetical protein